MELITRQLLANDVVLRRDRYYGNEEDDVKGKLQALGKTPDPDAVDSIIGNKNWTYHFCSECEEVRPEIVQFSVDVDSEEYVFLCTDCLTKALELINNTK